MGCCSVKTVNTWSILVLVSTGLLIAGGAWLYTEISDLGTQVGCVTTSLTALLASAADTGDTAASDAASAIPADVMDLINTWVPYLAWAVLTPAIVNIVIMLFAATCGICRASSPEKGFCCAKFFVILADIFLIVAFVLYAILAALGPLIQQPMIQDQIDIATAQCDNTEPLRAQVVVYQNLIDYTNEQIVNATRDGLDTTELEGRAVEQQLALANADEALTTFEGICGCLDNILGTFPSMMAPAILCVVGAVLAYIFINGQCCAMGCCSVPVKPKKPVTPVGDLVNA